MGGEKERESGKGKEWEMNGRKIIKLMVNNNNSCFNAFSRVDVRVEVKIPGGVEYYFVDVRGER